MMTHHRRTRKGRGSEITNLVNLRARLIEVVCVLDQQQHIILYLLQVIILTILHKLGGGGLGGREKRKVGVKVGVAQSKVREGGRRGRGR